MTDKKKLVFVMLEWSPETGRIIRYKREGDIGESRLSVPSTTPDETIAGIVADVFQGDCTFEKGQLIVNSDALIPRTFVPLTPEDFEGSEWVARYGFASFHDGSPYEPLPPHAGKILDAAQKRIAELEAEVAELRSGFTTARAAEERGARLAFEWLWENADVALREPRHGAEMNELCIDVAWKRLSRWLAARAGR